MEHDFTPIIKAILSKHFGEDAEDLFEKSHLLQYINLKTVSATRGSKARSSFANLYAIYVLAEDYIYNEFDKKGDYSSYEGVQFSMLLRRQRELPFGRKLQNHALNHRLNEEFRKFFPQCDAQPILRVVEAKRYWINEKLIVLSLGRKSFNLVRPIIEIIDAYSEMKQASFEAFIKTCLKLKEVSKKKGEEVEDFVSGLLAPNVDARIFEIVSYAILKHFYLDQIVYFGFQLDELEESPLLLYKTGRTNAVDGGIDFVMKPLGRFFQVTETIDVRKYFLDIDKIERYPITFVIKSMDSVDELLQKLRDGAERLYHINAIVDRYMACIEEVINIPTLQERFRTCVAQGYLRAIMKEIVLQSKVEFNYEWSDEEDAEEE